jgi:hypothetical protein
MRCTTFLKTAMLLVAGQAASFASDPTDNLPPILSVQPQFQAEFAAPRSYVEPIVPVFHAEPYLGMTANFDGGFAAYHQHASTAYRQSDSAMASCVVCDRPWWAHRSSIFGEGLYLAPGGTDVIYAIEQSGTGGSASPTGPVGISNIGHEMGFRVGFTHALTDKSSIGVSFARWDGSTTSEIEANGTNVLASTLFHPSTATVGSASLVSQAAQRMNFQQVDLTFQKVYRAFDCGILNWNMGLRYGNLGHHFSSSQTVSVPVGLTTVNTDVNFEGFGILAGLDGVRYARESGLLLYGKALGSLLGGEWKANYRQTNQFNTAVIANNYTDFRITPVVDTEIGFGWRDESDCFRMTAGYLFSTWFNTVNNRDYAQAVRSGQYSDLDESQTFSGLTFRAEMRF